MYTAICLLSLSLVPRRACYCEDVNKRQLMGSPAVSVRHSSIVQLHKCSIELSAVTGSIRLARACLAALYRQHVLGIEQNYQIY